MYTYSTLRSSDNHCYPLHFYIITLFYLLLAWSFEALTLTLFSDSRTPSLCQWITIISFSSHNFHFWRNINDIQLCPLSLTISLKMMNMNVRQWPNPFPHPLTILKTPVPLSSPQVLYPPLPRNSFRSTCLERGSALQSWKPKSSPIEKGMEPWWRNIVANSHPRQLLQPNLLLSYSRNWRRQLPVRIVLILLIHSTLMSSGLQSVQLVNPTNLQKSNRYHKSYKTMSLFYCHLIKCGCFLSSFFWVVFPMTHILYVGSTVFLRQLRCCCN